MASEKVQTLTDSNFDQSVIKSPKPVLVCPATFREVMPFCYWLIAPKFSPDAISRN